MKVMLVAPQSRPAAAGTPPGGTPVTSPTCEAVLTVRRLIRVRRPPTGPAPGRGWGTSP